MAMQIMPGKVSGKAIVYPDDCPQINVTENLRPVCEAFFREETFLEDGEEITVGTVHLDGIRALSEAVETEMRSLLNRLRTAKGDAEKEELAAAMEDFILFRSLMISELSVPDPRGTVLTIS